MRWLRYFTWYYRYTLRWAEYVFQLHPTGSTGWAQLVHFVFYVFIPGVIGAVTFCALYVTGLTRLFTDDYFPSFIRTDGTGILAHGATTFAATATAVAILYWLLGLICLMPDALRPPNYQNKKHVWKDWPES